MKVFSMIAILFLLVVGCSPEKENTAESVPELANIPDNIRKKIENIKYLDSANFAKVNANVSAISKTKFDKTASSEHKMLVEKFCKNSKGYQKGVWENQNDCSWAIEKSKLELFSEWVSRFGDTLVVTLKNGEKIDFVNDRSNPDQVLYYQFKNYLQDQNIFVVEAIQKGKCRLSKLIKADDGSSFSINGIVYFSKDQNTFLAATFNNELPLHCTNKIELYKIANAQLEKIWHIPTGDWGASDAKFLSQKEILLEQSTTDIPLEYKRYAIINIAK